MTALMRAEWIKLWTMRSTWWCLVALAVVTVGICVAVDGAAVSAFHESGTMEPVPASLQGGLLFGQLVIGVLGVLAVTSEYATGTIQAGVMAEPRRERLLAAKALVLTCVTFVAGQVVAFSSFLFGQWLFAGQGAPHAGLPGSLPAVIGAGLYLALLGTLGVAVGFLVRSTAGGVVVMASLTVLVLAVLPLLPSWVARFWPTVAGMQVIVPGASWEGFALYAAFVAAAVAAAVVVFRSRDVRR